MGSLDWTGLTSACNKPLDGMGLSILLCILSYSIFKSAVAKILQQGCQYSFHVFDHFRFHLFRINERNNFVMTTCQLFKYPWYCCLNSQYLCLFTIVRRNICIKSRKVNFRYALMPLYPPLALPCFVRINRYIKLAVKYRPADNTITPNDVSISYRNSRKQYCTTQLRTRKFNGKT